MFAVRLQRRWIPTLYDQIHAAAVAAIVVSSPRVVPAFLLPAYRIARSQVQDTVDAVARLVETREALAIKRLVVNRKK
jgi:hypothetical protein